MLNKLVNRQVIKPWLVMVDDSRSNPIINLSQKWWTNLVEIQQLGFFQVETFPEKPPRGEPWTGCGAAASPGEDALR